MKRIICVVMFFLLCNHGHSYSIDQQVESNANFVLESPMIDLLDGKSFAINGKVFGLMLQVRREVRKRLYGISTKSGKRIGMYRFDGRSYSLTALSKIESEYEMEFYAKRDLLMKNKSSYSHENWEAEFRKVEQDYQERKKRLRETLEEAKKDFINITASYVEGARGTKEQVLLLIKESCEKRGLKNCFILKWGETKEGHETEALENEISTFKEFSQFCYDLTNFLEDLARSCPKAKKQFIELIKSTK